MALITNTNVTLSSMDQLNNNNKNNIFINNDDNNKNIFTNNDDDNKNIFTNNNDDNKPLPPLLKKTKGRRRVEIKKVEAASNRHVTFSKRKKGLFNKAAELSLLTGAETAAFVVSSNGRIFGFGSPSCDSVIKRYLTETNPQDALELNNNNNNNNGIMGPAHLASLRQELMEARRRMEVEKKRAMGMKKRKSEEGCRGGAASAWWEEEVVLGEQSPEELESYVEALQRLKSDVERRVQQMVMNAPCNFTSLMDGRVYMGEN